MTGRVWHLSMVVSLHHEAGPLLPVSFLDKVGILLQWAALLGLILATVESAAIRATNYQG